MSPPTYWELRERHPPPSTMGSMPLRHLVEILEAEEIVIPDYQRGRAWTEDQSSAFVGHWLEGGSVSPLYVQRWADPARPEELVDGLQRATALHRFYRGEIQAHLHDGVRFYFQELQVGDQKRVAGHTLSIPIAYLTLATRADVLRFYLRVNRGVAHAPSELARVEALLAAEVVAHTEAAKHAAGSAT